MTEFSVSTWQQPMPPAPSPERARILDRLAEMIDTLGDHRLRVAIDGLTAAGKTSLGHELAHALSRRGRPVLRASLDDFKRPWAERHRYDRVSGEGYYRNAFDREAACRLLLDPSDPDADGIVALCSIDPLTQIDHSAVTTAMPENGVLIVDGVFAYRPEINAYWDLRVWIEIDAELSVRRGIERDAEMDGGPARGRGTSPRPLPRGRAPVHRRSRPAFTRRGHPRQHRLRPPSTRPPRGLTSSAPAYRFVLTHELLGALRSHLGDDTLGYAEPPRRLSGGFFTENHAFRLAGAPPGWDAPLVLRLFPNGATPDLAFREASVQSALTAQRFPAAPVLWFDNEARLDDRRFFVMQCLPGRALIPGIRPRELVSAARVIGRLPEITAEVQARLHQQDAGELARTLGAGADGVARGLAVLETAIAEGAVGFRAALRWLVEHRPDDPGPRAICHGDLWGGNILVDEKGRISGVLDWTTCAIAEPAFDVGATALAFCLIPMPNFGPLHPLLERGGRVFYRQFLDAYQRRSGADLSAWPYYEALRCASELSFVAGWRLAEAGGGHDLPRPSWDLIPERLIEFFRIRTGVTIALPARAG